MIKLVELGKVADVNWGDTSVTKASYVVDGFPAYSATGSDGFLPYFDFDRDGIVLSAIGARCGKTWFASGKWSVIKNTIRFWSESKDLDNKYLYWLTADPDFWPKRGAAQPFITIGDARKLKIPLPPLEEQKRIAAILDQADDISRKRKHAIDRLNQLGQAIFYEMFGDPTKPDRNDLCPLSDCMRLINGRAYSKFEEKTEGTPVIRIQNLNGGKRWFYSDLELPEDKYCISGDLLFAWSASFGPYIWQGPKSIYHYHIWKIEPFSGICDKIYAYQLLALLSDSVRAEGVGISMTHATKSGMEKRKIPLPSFSEQLEFRKRFEQLAAVKIGAERSLEKTLELFTSLQHRAFAGEL